jgi:hypothetical protein
LEIEAIWNRVRSGVNGMPFVRFAIPKPPDQLIPFPIAMQTARPGMLHLSIQFAISVGPSLSGDGVRGAPPIALVAWENLGALTLCRAAAEPAMALAATPKPNWRRVRRLLPIIDLA